MATYLAGELVAETCLFSLPDSTPINPTTVTLRVRQPDGTVTTPVPANPTVGTFTANLDTTGLPGSWLVEWVAPPASGCQSVALDAFDVTQLPF